MRNHVRSIHLSGRRTRVMFHTSLSGWMGVALWACTGSGSGPEAPAIQVSGDHVRATTAFTMFSGCQVVQRGAACEVQHGAQLVVWGPGSKLRRVRFDTGEVACFERLAIEGGTRCRVAVPAGAGWFEYGTSEGRGRRRLALVMRKPAPAVDRAMRLRARGKVARAIRMLHEAWPSLDSAGRADARALLARLHLSQGAFDTAASELHDSMRANMRAGRVSAALEDGLARTFVLITRLAHYEQARTLLVELEQAAELAPASVQALPYYRGLLSLYVGDVRSALRELRSAGRGARRLFMVRHELFAQEALARQLSILGRHREALAVQERLLAAAGSLRPCEQLERIESLVWFSMAASSGGFDRAARAQRAIEQGDGLLLACEAQHVVRNHHKNAALFALSKGDERAVRYRLDVLARLKGGRDATQSAWEEELQGRVALAAAAPRRAAHHFEREWRLAERSGLWKNIYLGHLGFGDSLSALGERTAAMAAYLRADTAAAQLLRSVPLGEGRTEFQVDHEAAARALAALLVKDGQAAEALAMLRGTRVRVLATAGRYRFVEHLSSQARTRWQHAVARYRRLRAALERDGTDSWRLSSRQLQRMDALLQARRIAVREALDQAYLALTSVSAAELPGLPSDHDHVLIAFFATRDGPMGFCARAGIVHAVALRTRSGQAALGDDPWLAPFTDCLHSARAIQVVTDGTHEWVDVHALRLHGRPLIALAPVAYSMDLRPRVPAPPVSSVLSVHNPTGRMPDADAEQTAVAHFAGAIGADMNTLVRAEATRESVLSALGVVSLFHYAGHGRAAGHDGEGSGLMLADGLLSAADVLMASRVPSHVVLAACEGSKTDSPGLAGGFGLAQAFLLAGAQQVVAAPRLVADRTAHHMVALLYEALSGTPQDLAGALRSAQLVWLNLGRNPEDWSAFRVLQP